MSVPVALVIEDDPDLSIIFSESLKAAGFQVESVHNGTAGRQWLTENRPDVVVLDLHLPNMSGAELMEWIRTEERLANTQVIVTTADPRMADMLQDQADLVLIKPISFSQLRDLAKRLVSAMQH